MIEVQVSMSFPSRKYNNRQYLGSTVVKELRGTESTRKSIQKLRRSGLLRLEQQQQNAGDTNGGHPSAVASKRPLKLSISHRGVQFIDIVSHVSFSYSNPSDGSQIILSSYVDAIGNDLRTRNPQHRLCLPGLGRSVAFRVHHQGREPEHALLSRFQCGRNGNAYFRNYAIHIIMCT